MRGALVDDHPVRHADLGQLGVEALERLQWPEVGTGYQQEEWRLQPGNVSDAGGVAVETDGAAQTVAFGGLAPGVASAEAEADREHRSHPTALFRAQVLHRCPDVGADP